MAGSTNGKGSAKTQVQQAVKPKGQCHWIDWNSVFIQKVLPDPTRIFSFLVIGIIILRYLESHEWDVSLILSGFILNPYVVISFAIACATLYVSRPTAETKPLPIYDRWAVEWYWWNAWFYHMVMDGASGTFQLVPVVVHQYQMLDKRFSNHHPVPWTVGAIELFIMGPLCLAVVYCILKRHPARFPLELIVSSFQVMGMILFIAAEVMEGQLNVPALDPVGVPGNRWANVKFFDFYHFTYYWFGFWFCNLIWYVMIMWKKYYRLLCGVDDVDVDVTYQYLLYMDGSLYLAVMDFVLMTLLCFLSFSSLTCRSIVPYYRIVRAVEECIEALDEKQKKD
jgi:hypothetical protein